MRRRFHSVWRVRGAGIPLGLNFKMISFDFGAVLRSLSFKWS